MRRTTCAIALAALTAVAVPGVLPAGANTKKPKPPTTATIKRLLTKAYCAPTTNIRGEAQTTVKVTFKSIKRGKRRLGNYATDGTPANRKTWVFPIRAKYFCDYKYIDNSTPSLKAPDTRISGDYSFFRDEFGSWVQKNHGHNAESLPGNN
jgi:hypothetical protein